MSYTRYLLHHLPPDEELSGQAAYYAGLVQSCVEFLNNTCMVQSDGGRTIKVCRWDELMQENKQMTFSDKGVPETFELIQSETTHTDFSDRSSKFCRQVFADATDPLTRRANDTPRIVKKRGILGQTAQAYVGEEWVVVTPWIARHGIRAIIYPGAKPAALEEAKALLFTADQLSENTGEFDSVVVTPITPTPSLDGSGKDIPTTAALNGTHSPEETSPRSGNHPTSPTRGKHRRRSSSGGSSQSSDSDDSQVTLKLGLCQEKWRRICDFLAVFSTENSNAFVINLALNDAIDALKALQSEISEALTIAGQNVPVLDEDKVQRQTTEDENLLIALKHYYQSLCKYLAVDGTANSQVKDPILTLGTGLTEIQKFTFLLQQLSGRPSIEPEQYKHITLSR